LERLKIKNKKIICIIQCRLGSTRFKNKALKKIGNYRIIEWVIRRVKESKRVDKIYLATTRKKEDIKLVEIAKNLKIEVYRGSSDNVFSRFYKIFRTENPDYVIRVCADNPFISSTEIDKLIFKAIKFKSDYIFNHIPYKNNNYIDGLGAECISARSINRLAQVKKSKAEKEHVSMYIWKKKKFFKFNYFCARGISRDNERNLKLDIDYDYQYEFFRRILKAFKSPPENLNINYLINKIIQ